MWEAHDGTLRPLFPGQDLRPEIALLHKRSSGRSRVGERRPFEAFEPLSQVLDANRAASIPALLDPLPDQPVGRTCRAAACSRAQSSSDLGSGGQPGPLMA